MVNDAKVVHFVGDSPSCTIGLMNDGATAYYSRKYTRMTVQRISDCIKRLHMGDVKGRRTNM